MGIGDEFQISTLIEAATTNVKGVETKNSPKTVKVGIFSVGINSKTKIFKNPPKIQFWSYCKKPYVKINQKSKTYQIG